MSCEHLDSFGSVTNFLSPHLTKTTWICLYDGCFKLKKNMTQEELIIYTDKLQPLHRVMINCQSFQIFCALCKKELFDEPQGELRDSKRKKYKSVIPMHYRLQCLFTNQEESVIFAGNSEYPPSFQKEKRGICGLKVNGINSYLNSVIHLLAYVPVLTQIFKTTNPKNISTSIVRYLSEAINTIWSGQFRIYSIDKLEAKLNQIDPSFLSYSQKSPQKVLYFILRCLLQEFYFEELPCSPMKIITEPYDQWSNHSAKYFLAKQIFGGQCILEKNCSHCQHSMNTVNRFECLKVSYEGQHQNFKGVLYALIEQALNWRNSHQVSVQKLQQSLLKCQKCQQTSKQFFSYVNLPNNLIIQFGEQLNGLNVELPEEINLTKYTQQFVKKKDDKNNAIFDYIGSISRKNKRFYTHVKHFINKKEFMFCDESIHEMERPQNNIKLAIYRRRPDTKNQPLLKNIMSCIEVGLNPVVPLPDFWSLFLKENHQIPPLVNPFICSHGKLKSNLELSKMNEGPQKIPIQIYQYLLEMFGGRQISINKQDDYCQECQSKISCINQIKASEKEMAAFADKLSHKKAWVYISRSWLDKWKKFVYSQNKKGYKLFGNPRPDEINNNTSKQKEQQISTTHKKISQQVWYFLQQFYGGGPIISNKQYKPNVVVTTSINLRFQSLKEQLQMLGCQREKNIQFQEYKIEELEEDDSQLQ